MLVPDKVNKDEFTINWCFKNMSDVLKGKVFSGKSCVGATNRLGQYETPLCLIQMERSYNNEHPFEETRDRNAFWILGKIFNSIVERLHVQSRT